MKMAEISDTACNFWSVAINVSWISLTKSPQRANYLILCILITCIQELQSFQSGLFHKAIYTKVYEICLHKNFLTTRVLTYYIYIYDLTNKMAGSGHPWCTTAKQDKIQFRMSKSDRKILVRELYNALRNYYIDTSNSKMLFSVLFEGDMIKRYAGHILCLQSQNANLINFHSV